MGESDMITVIEQTTSERKQETKELFEQIRPLLDKGYGYNTALRKINKISSWSQGHYYQQAWFRDLREYGESQGYSYRKYSGKGRKK